MLAGDGKGLIYLPFLNYVDGNLDGCHEMLVHPHTVPGLGDGGAHVGTICDGSSPRRCCSTGAVTATTTGSRCRSSCNAIAATPPAPSDCWTVACSPRGTAPI